MIVPVFSLNRHFLTCRSPVFKTTIQQLLFRSKPGFGTVNVLQRAPMSAVINPPETSIVDKMESTALEDTGTKAKCKSEVKEGRVTLVYNPEHKLFYNPIQEFNRDISILALATYIESEAKNRANVTVFEAMAASGIRSIRYAKEIPSITQVIANDMSETAVESIKTNAERNGVDNVVASLNDASAAMHSYRHKCFVVDLDPYGTPVPFLDAAMQAISTGGLLMVTATDLAILAGNSPTTCYAKYGAMPLKSKACHEMALRIIIHTVQSCANRYGHFVTPLLSLKIDFYARIFFKVVKSPEKAKSSAINESMVYQCKGCHSLAFQPMATERTLNLKDGRTGPRVYTMGVGPPVDKQCVLCGHMGYQVGGPMWTSPLHDREFITKMLSNLETSFQYLTTYRRIEGILNVANEELDTPSLYDMNQLCSVVKCSSIPAVPLRSAILNAGYSVSYSHVGPGLFKTTAPIEELWRIICSWKTNNPGDERELEPSSPGHTIFERFRPNDTTPSPNFNNHTNANPPSRENNLLRFQMNPAPHWGPGSRDINHATGLGQLAKSRAFQGKRKLKPGSTPPEIKKGTNESMPDQFN